MMFKKSIVSSLLISGLALSMSSGTFAKEVSSLPAIEAKPVEVSSVFKPQGYYSDSMLVGQELDVYNPQATRYQSDRKAVATVDHNGIVTAHSTGTVHIAVMKGNTLLDYWTIEVY